MPQTTAWMKLVLDMKKKHPTKKLSEILQMAKKIYRKK